MSNLCAKFVSSLSGTKFCVRILALQPGCPTVANDGKLSGTIATKSLKLHTRIPASSWIFRTKTSPRWRPSKREREKHLRGPLSQKADFCHEMQAWTPGETIRRGGWSYCAGFPMANHERAE